MHISLNWLSDYVDIPKNITPAELQDKITTSIAEVEKIHIIGRDGILVAKVLSVTKHPNADRLNIARVSTGKKEFTVVCGGINLKEGMLVAYAELQARVKWHGEGDLVTLEKATIRGVESEGMICASSEIDLPLPCGEKDITDLTGVVTTKDIGRNVYNVLELRDVVLEVDNKSLTNRPDLFGHYGLARDLVAALNSQNNVHLKLKPYPEKKINVTKDKLDITVDTPHCRRFVALRVSNVSIEPSPLWLTKRLELVGIRPINNVVDITNYVMYDLGQPMHAFDARELEGNKLRVSQGSGEKILALDGKEYTLTKDDIVIFNRSTPTSIAGIMGGQGSGVHSDSTSVVFEAASWDPATVRKTSQRLGLRSEASTRFEKNLDPELCPLAMNRAVGLLLQLCPQAKVSSALYDVYSVKIKLKPIKLRLERIQRKVGIPITASKTREILKDLGCKVIPSGKQAFSVTAPSWRSTKDLKSEDDLIEEVARMYGYHLIPITMPEGALRANVQFAQQRERKLKNILVFELGFFEVRNYPFTNLKEQAAFGLATNGLVGLQNPLSLEQTHLKTSLIPNMLATAKRNIHEQSTFSLFELGRVYKGEQGVKETKRLAGIMVLEKQDKMTTYDSLFFQLKQKLEILFERLALPGRRYEPATQTLLPFDLGQTATMWVGDRELGYISVVRPEQKATWDLEHHDVAVFEIDLQVVLEDQPPTLLYQALPKFPVVVRDFAFVIQKNVPSVTVAKTIGEAHPAVARVDLFDVYEAQALGAHKKSLAYQVTLANSEKTFTEVEIEQISKTIVEHVGHLGGTLRV